METISLIIMVAIVCEALVEYFKTIMKIIELKEYKTAITQGITIALGIGLAFVFNLQLFNNALSEFYDGISINPTIDIILTGILFSRGANYFSDLVTKLTGGKAPVVITQDDLVYDPLNPTDTLSSEDGTFAEDKEGE
jgi:hypothetical protein